MQPSPVTINPLELSGPWRRGFALDLHTLSSTYLGDAPSTGRPQFETKRSEIGELLYQLKYQQNADVVQRLAETVASFVGLRWPDVELIVPVPASKVRSVQPVPTLARAIADHLHVKYSDCMERMGAVPELKDVTDPDQRKRAVTDSLRLIGHGIRDRNILLFDDLYRSGTTICACTELLQTHRPAAVYALTLTKTRSNK